MTPRPIVRATATRDAFDLVRRFEGSVLEQVDLSPIPELLVMRFAGERSGWVALRGAFDLGLNGYELGANDRLLARIANAKWHQAQFDRLAAVAARRADTVMPTESSVDDCPPHGIRRPVVRS